MPERDTIGLKQAVQSILARTGLYWVAVIVVTLAYWQIATEGRFNWFVPLLFAGGLWLWLFGRADRADFQAIDRLKRGVAPREGQWSAVHGIATHADAADKEASDILACRFQSFDRLPARGQSRPGYALRYDGFYMIPFGLDTGAALVPGGNGTLLLYSMPSASPSGWVAFAAMTAVIALTFLPHRSGRQAPR